MKILSLVLCLSIFIASPTCARDLVSAANIATSNVKQIAQAAGVIGVIAGGVIMQFPGAGQFGRSVLVSGLVGCLCSFGAGAFLSLMRSMFGGI